MLKYLLKEKRLLILITKIKKTTLPINQPLHHLKVLIEHEGISMITKVRPQSSHIMIKLVVNSNFVLNKIALLDNGADRNCSVKGLILTKYLQKGTKKL